MSSSNLISKFEPLWDAPCLLGIIENNENTALVLRKLFENLFPQAVIYVFGKHEWPDADLIIEKAEEKEGKKFDILTFCGSISGEPHPLFREYPIFGIETFTGLNPNLIAIVIAGNLTVLEMAEKRGADVVLDKSKMEILQSRDSLIEYIANR